MAGESKIIETIHGYALYIIEGGYRLRDKEGYNLGEYKDYKKAQEKLDAWEARYNKMQNIYIADGNLGHLRIA